MPRRKAERFPLTLHHATGQWSKSFTLPSGRRKSVYFGTDRDAALSKYLGEREDWQVGRNPRENATTATTAITLADLINAFLARSKARVAENEISPLTFGDYLAVGQKLTEQFGRNRDPQKFAPADFASFRRVIATKYAPSRLSKTITVVRMIFKWGYDAELLEKPVRFGPDFKVAAKRAARAHRTSMGAKLLTPEEIRKLLKHADTPLTAMILLGINCGLSNADIAALPITAIDLDRALLTFARVKTGIERKIPLWPETVKALRKVLAMRNPRPGFDHLVFVTGRGGPLMSITSKENRVVRVDQTVEWFKRAAVAAGIHRPRMGFLWLRHCVQTVGDETRDFLAVSAVMGHSDGTMGGHYRETISDERLRAVTDHLRQWLFGKAKPAIKREKAAAPDKPKLRVVG